MYLTKETLNSFKSKDVRSCNSETLVDLKSVFVDASMPIQDRLQDFIQKIHNPYLFKVGDLIVSINFSGEKPLSGSLLSALQA